MLQTSASTAEVRNTAAAAGRLVSVYREFERPGVCWIGAVRRSQTDTLTLLEVNVAGGWARMPRYFDLEDLTRLLSVAHKRMDYNS